MADSPPTQNLERLLAVPAWLGNIIAFLLLFFFFICIVIIQNRMATTSFLKDATEHAEIAAQIIQLNLQKSRLAISTTNQIVATFLSNTAHFIEYLDGIEPMGKEELEAFSAENNLAGISIFKKGRIAVAPQNWSDIACNAGKGLVLDSSGSIMAYVLKSEDGCIITGMENSDIEKMRHELDIPTVLTNIKQIKGINDVKLLSSDKYYNPNNSNQILSSNIVNLKYEMTAEVTVATEIGRLVVSIDAIPLKERIKRQWIMFFWGALALFLTGSLLSWLLYKQHMKHIVKTQEYERLLAARREDASLGRAASAIAHEIRNPLNAISMGLQRLKREATHLTEEQQKLIKISLDALKRTNSSITGLLNYSKPFNPEPEQVDVSNIIQDMLILYADTLQNKKIELQCHALPFITVFADKHLISQVIDNLIKNAIEAMPEGGYLKIETYSQEKMFHVIITNNGNLPTLKQLEQLLEPYFSTKTKGTGLGLAICNRIITAHGGLMELGIKDTEQDEQEFFVHFSLPIKGAR